MPPIEFHLNQGVAVRLTEQGRAIHRRAFSGSEPNLDANGWTVYQFWMLMRIFGPHMMLNRDSPFEATILLYPDS